MVKVVINGKEVLVYPDEASILIEKGLACYPGEEKAIQKPVENKAIQEAPENKASLKQKGRPKNASK